MGEFLSMLGDFWEVVRYPLGGVACLAGAFLCIVSAIGILRFPDFYTRIHAASVTETSGASLLLIGMALMAPHWLILVKLLCIFIFLFLTNPTSTHALVNAAHVAGLQPRIGPVGATNLEDEA